jgi:hypothetical protein
LVASAGRTFLLLEMTASGGGGTIEESRISSRPNPYRELESKAILSNPFSLAYEPNGGDRESSANMLNVLSPACGNAFTPSRDGDASDRLPRNHA